MGVFLLMASVLANLQPSPCGGRLLLAAYEQFHGLPLVYMDRDSQPPWAEMSIYHGPWPFLDPTPAICGFSWLALAINVGTALLTLFLATRAISTWLQRCYVAFRTATLSLMAITCTAWCILAAKGLHYARLPCGSNTFEFPSIALLWLVPVFVYLLAMALAYALAFHWLIRPMQPSGLLTLRWLIGLLATFCFLVYVAAEFAPIARRLDLPSLMLTTLLVFAALKLCWRLASRSETLFRTPVVQNIYLIGFPLSSWLATTIVGGTGFYFVYFDVTDICYAKDGETHFYAYGWPWVHLVSTESNLEFFGYQTTNDWTIGTIDYPAFAANTFVLIAMAIGTLAAASAASRITRVRFAFRLKDFFSLCLLVAIPLSLSEASGRNVMWTNWYVQFVLSVGLAAIGYLIVELLELAMRTPQREKSAE